MSQQSQVTMPTGTIFEFDPDQRTYLCTHSEAYIERACCSGRDNEDNPSCGCNGQDAVLCPAQDCTGVEPYEVETLIERLQ